MNSKLISVVLPSYNRADVIGMTLERLCHQTIATDRFEVIVVDDGSKDQSSDIVITYQDRLNIKYYYQNNKGVAAARNLGVYHAEGWIIVFLDCDEMPEVDFLEQHEQMHQENPRCLINGQVRSWPNPQGPWYDRVIDPDSVLNYGEVSGTIPFYLAIGGNLSVQTQAFSELGGFDEEFPGSGGEETEFVYRATLEGYPFKYCPEAITYHNHPRTIKQRISQQSTHARSLALLIQKHPEIQFEIPDADDYFPVFYTPRKRFSYIKRLRKSFYAMSPVRTIISGGLNYLNRKEKYPRLVKFLYWRLIFGRRTIGFREGLKQHRQA
jgi:glycosyltransferase involved in cell wall biosynthesis